MSESTTPKVSADSVSTESETEKTKVAAVCTSCGEIYAAEQASDGEVRPIGRKDGCRCGVGTFEAIGTEAAN
ncbi:hypothetical protein [Halostagnicola sp. A-GB9-2]|uniref:hypothetical protein n=1 Tax=Halostagnicola sp. A-GB9-2 TaxID=3048066 RepID=UPI0024BFF16C|nr:hypothetical protein [Halostagnicola sp. A-GB9-2]MDJ1431350.1 hypothetical protein [Halostagnicola sp. A-GB9-2]